MYCTCIMHGCVSLCHAACAMCCVSLCHAAWFRFQELDLSAQALVGVESSREEPWIGAVELTLRKAGNYHKVHHHPITITLSPSPHHHHQCTTTYHYVQYTLSLVSLSLSVRWQLLHHRLVGIMLLVYINPDLLECVSDQQVEYVTTGMGGLMVSGMMSSLHHHHPRMKVGLHLVSVVCLPGQQGWSGSKVQPIPHVSVLPQLPLCSLHGGGGQEEPGSPTLTLSPPPPPSHSPPPHPHTLPLPPSHSPPPTLPLPPSQDYHTIRNKMLFDKIPDYKYSIMEHE